MRVLLVALLACGGCLGSAHTIPKEELMAVARRPPEARGQRLRVVQSLGEERPPPEGCCDATHVGVHVHGDGNGPGQSGGGSSSGSSRPSGSADANIDDARVLLIAAAAFTVVLAVSEGQRFNGWVEVDPDHPVHLWGPYGEYMRVPLAELDPVTAASATKAYVRPEDGRLRHVERAPLDRRGLTWAMLAGSAEIGGASGIRPGFMSHMQLGYFPHRAIGLAFDLGIGWRDEERKDTAYQIQTGAELQLYPVSAGRIHAGLYGQLGFAARSDDGAGRDTTSRVLSGGALLQLDLTTYLAVTARAGMSRAFDEHASEITAGLAIY